MTTTTTEALAQAKDCPFCGSVVLAQEGHHLTCMRCGAAGPDADSLAIGDVVAAWNRRSPPQDANLQASLDVALHDLAALQAEADAKPPKPFPAYGQCETCGVFSDSAKALHDARRNCA